MIFYILKYSILADASFVAENKESDISGYLNGGTFQLKIV